jgi:hypothetical protein
VQRTSFPSLLIAFHLTVVLAQSDTAIFRLKEIHNVLVNPGMGITTFQRFNGQAPNSGLEWSEEGPVRKLEDAAVKPDFPDSSIAYCRWFWSTLEPEEGKVRWEILDGALEQARLHQQTLAIRLMPYDQKHPLPEWYQNSGARRANKPSDKDGEVWQPDFSDPLYLKYWGRLISTAGARYDGHPYLDTVDVSSIGYWGEGWSPYMPEFRHQQALTDIYLYAFKRTPLLMNFDEPNILTYATQHGTGWRLDCLGDMRSADNSRSWSHMLDFYPQQVVRAGIHDAWQHSPVSLETCWVPGYWKQKGWDVDYILEQALRWHVTSLNIKSSVIPSEWKDKFDDFQRRMGYRLLLRRLEYPRTTGAGKMMPVRMWWFNAGVAPAYRDYQLAIQFYSSKANGTLRVPVDVRRWLPGDSVVEENVYVPESLSAGKYLLRVALLDPRTSQPAIRLAIEGRQSDGWYDVGELRVE